MATTKEIMAMSLDDLIADAVARKDKDALLWLQKERNKSTPASNGSGLLASYPHSNYNENKIAHTPHQHPLRQDYNFRAANS